jgi:solute:Na+ symporter, SSS family
MPTLHPLNGLDYAVVAGYLLLVAGVGAYVARFNTESGDYFKGGGRIPWGLAAVSLFVGGFSAFMFVGAAGFTYRNGGAALVLFTSAFWAYLIGAWLYGPLWRRARLDTPLEFLARRYSPSTTYVYTLLAIVPNVLMLGIALYTLCIFIATALGLGDRVVDLGLVQMSGFALCVWITGLVMVFYSVTGGLWAVMVTDTLQFLVLLLVSLVVFPAVFMALGDGHLFAGFGRMVREAPDGYFALTLKDQTPMFFVAYAVNVVLGYNVNWYIGQRYFSVPDERDTRRMAFTAAAFSLVTPLLWIVPVMGARVLFPDLAAMWPTLKAPSEAAFVTVAMAVLPHGVLGLVVAAIFAAATSAADGTLNWLSAVLTKDVFAPLGRRITGREPSEKTQLAVGRLVVLVLGLVGIAVALTAGRYGGAFDVFIKVNSLYAAPMFVPVLFGLVFTRTPWWSGMASFVAGVAAIVVVGLLANRAAGLPAAALTDLFRDVRVAPLGISLGRYELNTLVGFAVATGVFFATALVRRRQGAFAARIAAFEADLGTPAHADPGAALDLRGLRAYRLAGRLSIAIGLALMALTPFTWAQVNGYLNAVVGGIAVALGGATLRWATRYPAQIAAGTGLLREDGGRDAESSAPAP